MSVHIAKTSTSLYIQEKKNRFWDFFQTKHQSLVIYSFTSDVNKSLKVLQGLQLFFLWVWIYISLSSKYLKNLHILTSPRWRYLLFFLRKYFHDDTTAYSWCPGEELRQTLSAIKTQNELFFYPLISLRPVCPLVCFVSVASSSRSLHFNPLSFVATAAFWFFASQCDADGKRKCFAPWLPTPERVKKRRKPTFHPDAFRSSSYFPKLPDISDN